MSKFDSSDLQRRSQELIDLIIRISDDTSELQQKDKHVEDFIEIYSGGWRHSYSVITQYFLNKYQKEAQLRELDGVLTDLVSKISLLLDILIQDQSEFSLDEKSLRNCRRNIEKLIDHLNLELIRKRYIEKLYKNVFKQASKSINAVHKVEDQIRDFSGKLEENTEDARKIKSESITILGIFSSIVGVLVAGVGLSSAIFANMEDISSWLLCALSCLIILFISNTLFQLFNFLREIAERQSKSSRLLWCFNVCLSIISAFCLYIHFYWF